MHTNTITECYHCGEDCLSESILFDNRSFCCNGCKTVYEILFSNELCEYYRLENMPGISPKIRKNSKFDYLENEEVLEKLLDFRDDNISRVQFYLPQIHCSSCLWLLENLYKLHPGVQQSRVNFPTKEVSIGFQHTELSLKELVELLSSLGYEPEINLDQMNKPHKQKVDRQLILQLGLAGFAFGNIMLLSLPEYFGLDLESYSKFRPWFGWLNLLLATPVSIYSGQVYFKSAWRSIQYKRLNIDVPIALGILVLYFQSSYEVLSATGAGYFDTLCGLLFFMLLGRLFKEKTYHQLSFERDYRSYFPISITKLSDGEESSIAVNKIKKGDILLIHNGELIPVDALILKGNARIDNSFATGESKALVRDVGDKVYAGGRQMGEAIELRALRPLSQSKLTQLWNNYPEENEEKATFSQITNALSQWFTPIILLIALVAGLYHFSSGIATSVKIIAAVLIVACPCALALAAPFTFGHATRWLGRKKCYLRDASVIEKMSAISHIVFDKTGTLTYSNKQQVQYNGQEFNQTQLKAVRTLLRQSNHALSRLILNSLKKTEWLPIQDFEEIPSKGMQAIIDGKLYRIGSSSWLGHEVHLNKDTCVLLEVDHLLIGYFSIGNSYRKGLKQLLYQLNYSYNLSMISGDNSGQERELKNFFPKNSIFSFNQNPKDKLDFINELKSKNEKVMMVGDGLNDAGALKQSDVGVALAEDVNAFSPACDLILSADNFKELYNFLLFSKYSRKIVILSFIISLLYNVVGLSLAVQGLLSPLLAAIIMPLSSVSVVGFASMAVWLLGKAYEKKQLKFQSF